MALWAYLANADRRLCKVRLSCRVYVLLRKFH